MAIETATAVAQLELSNKANENEFKGTEGIYLLPHHVEEIERLRRQHQFIKSSTGNELTHLELPRNARVLDSGCADGTWLADLARLDAPGHPNPTGLSLHGVDLGSTLFRQDESLDLREHNLKYKFPESWGWSNSFDLVHQRLLVWGIRSEEWEAVLDHLVDVVKPGGYIQLVEAEWVLPSYSEKQPQQRRLGLVQSWSTESAGMDVHIWKKLPGLLEARGLTAIREETFNLGYGATAARDQDRVWTAELLPQSFRHLARRIPEGGIPGVAADAGEYMLFLEQLVTEMSTVGYNPQLRWLTAQKPAVSG